MWKHHSSFLLNYFFANNFFLSSSSFVSNFDACRDFIELTLLTLFVCLSYQHLAFGFNCVATCDLSDSFFTWLDSGET